MKSAIVSNSVKHDEIKASLLPKPHANRYTCAETSSCSSQKKQSKESAASCFYCYAMPVIYSVRCVTLIKNAAVGESRTGALLSAPKLYPVRPAKEKYPTVLIVVCRWSTVLSNKYLQATPAKSQAKELQIVTQGNCNMQ